MGSQTSSFELAFGMELGGFISQNMMQKMMSQQEDIRSENRKVQERLERIEQGTPSRTRDTKRSLYDDLEEEVQ